MKKIQLMITSEGVLESFKSLLGSTFATGIAAISLMIYSRVLGPEQFGEFSVGFALVMIITRINDFGFNTSVLKIGSEKELNSEKNFVYSYTLKNKVIISLIIICSALFFSESIAEIFNFSNSTIVFISLTFGLATVYYEHLLNILQSLQRFNQGIAINILQALVKLVWAGILLIFGFTSTNITFFWYIFAPLIPVLFWKKLVGKNINIDFKAINPVIKNQVLLLTKHSAVGLIAAGLIENIDVLFLQNYLSSYEVGLYAGVYKIALIFSLGAYALSNVLFPRVARYKKKDDLKVFIKKAFYVLLLCILCFALFIPFGKIAILLTVGQQYLAGINILYILTAASFVSVATIPFVALFYSFDENWYFSLSGILQLAIVVLGNYLLVPIYGLPAAAMVKLIARGVILIFTIVAGMILYNKTYSKK